MKTPFKNRKDRIKFLIAKEGIKAVNTMCHMTDREVKQYVDALYPIYKDRPDFVEEPSMCLRCDGQIIWHSDCGCGMDRAVFDVDSWIEDIESNSEHFEEDYAFAKEHGIDLEKGN